MKALFIYFIFLECLATIADNIEPEKFKPIALQTLDIALRILNKTDDPDVKKSIFALFAALAGVMKEDISPVLPNIIENMITSVQSTDGIVVFFFTYFLVVFLSKFCGRLYLMTTTTKKIV